MGETLDDATRLRLRGWLHYMWKLGRDSEFKNAPKNFADALGINKSTLSLYMKDGGDRYPGLSTVVKMRNLGKAKAMEPGQRYDWPRTIDRLVDDDPPQVDIVTSTPGAASPHGAREERPRARGRTSSI